MAARPVSSLVSSLFGRFAARSFPGPFQRLINRTYVRTMGLDMSEFAPAESYGSLNALFTRALERSRRIDSDPRAVVAPCDALITDLGTIRRRQAYQIKGMAYDTGALLGEAFAPDAQRLEGGSYANFYLSPRDYHRYHAPLDLKVLALSHIPGKLYPVNLPLLRRKVNLFVENERVVLRCIDAADRLHFIVLVGALNVGKMVVSFESRVHTNSARRTPVHYRYAEPIPLKRGELFGWFEMGSTLVLLSQAGSLEYRITVGEKVRFAQTIAHYLQE